MSVFVRKIVSLKDGYEFENVFLFLDLKHGQTAEARRWNAWTWSGKMTPKLFPH